jgi:3-methylcrotonyl-CoA carboxylase alpha subunit
MQVVGVANNVAFLRDVVQSASFSQGDLDTDLITRERDNLFKTQTLSEDLAVAGVMGMVLRQEVDAMGSNPWQAVDGWQVVGAPPRPFQLQGAWGDEVRALDVVLYSAPQRLRIADMDHAFEWRAHPRGVSVCLNGVWTDLSVVASAGQYHVFSRAGHAVLQRVDPLAGSAQAADALGGLNTPMPGKLIRMDVAVGDTVAKGQVLAVMEAMKMEHSIASPRDGVVSEVFYAVGDQVAEGQALLTLQDVT